MVQKAPAKRGRPPKFDREAVVGAAIGAFFVSGYDATTLPDLEKATGLDRSSLYNSFGGKRGLYEAAISTYLEVAEGGLFEPLLVGTDDGYADLLTFFGFLRTGMTSPEAIPGCLIVNDMASGADPEAAMRYRGLLEEGMRRAIERGGETDQKRRDERAAQLTLGVIGVNLVSKTTGGDADEIGRHIDAMTATVLDWRDHA
ncbi:MAG: TetR/AcrR family transcriptional regulator [Actinomycetota bacterium]